MQLHAADATVTEETGIVQYKRGTLPNFDPAPVGISLYALDVVRTMESSTAVVLVESNQCSVRLRQLSTLEILPQESNPNPLLNLLRGALYFFSRESSHEVQIKTPHSTAAPRGTEFVILVDANRTALAMLDGTATLTNESGRVDLQSGEMGLASARPGAGQDAAGSNESCAVVAFLPGGHRCG